MTKAIMSLRSNVARPYLQNVALSNISTRSASDLAFVDDTGPQT